MEMHLDTTLQNLHCIIPTDPSGEDEPYLWVFFIVADGSTVRQRLDDPLRLSANITVQSGSGRPGNLNEAKASSGGNIHIPGSVGQYQSFIKPIVLNLPFETPPMKFFMPGRMVTICAAIDEEAVPRDAIEAAFNAVKVHIQNRLNDFFNGLPIDDIRVALLHPTDPIGAASRLFNERLDTVITQIRNEVPNIVEATAMAWVVVNVKVNWWDPGSWAGAFAALVDTDEPIGSHTFTIDEASIINHSLHEVLWVALRQPHTNPIVAWYMVSGRSNATLRFVPGDHRLTQLPEHVEKLGLPEQHAPRVDRKCMEPGTVVGVQRSAHTQQWQVIVNYPFMRYRYALDGQEMAGDSGTLRLSKVVSFPQFDESKFYFIGASVETRVVTINYQRLPVPGVPQLHRILISNDPADGNFDLHLTIDGLLPIGSTIPVASEGLSIVGQSIDFPDGFLQGYIACIARMLEEKRVRVKKTIPDSWRTPEVAWNQYKELVNQLADLQSLQIYDARTIEKIKQRIADKLKLEIPGALDL